MNQKGTSNSKAIVLLIFAIGSIGYFIWSNLSQPPSPHNNPPPTNEGETRSTNETPPWQFINADSFTLSLPPSWTFNKLQGTDSYVGEFVGDGAKLSFDYGWYSNSLAEEDDPDHTVIYETIDGYRAKIVTPKIIGNGTTGVYFGDLGGSFQKTRLQISGYDLTETQQKIALKIFRSLTFKK